MKTSLTPRIIVLLFIAFSLSLCTVATLQVMRRSPNTSTTTQATTSPTPEQTQSPTETTLPTKSPVRQTTVTAQPVIISPTPTPIITPLKRREREVDDDQ